MVHPTRDIDAPLQQLRGWAREHGAELVQVPVCGQERRVAEVGEAGRCDLIVSIGGDGTMLAALRAGALGGRPVLGMACGSLGALTTISVEELPRALDRFAAGEWAPVGLPALVVARSGDEDAFAINDVSVVRAGIGQVRSAIEIDGVLVARVAGDGCVVSTPVGSSAYGLAAGGPLLVPGADGFVLTPLPTHGGSVPPLVAGAASTLRIETTAGLDGARLELDGQIIGGHSGTLTVTLRPAVATRVSFADDESMITGLRRRGVLTDSPRIAVDARSAT